MKIFAASPGTAMFRFGTIVVVLLLLPVVVEGFSLPVSVARRTPPILLETVSTGDASGSEGGREEATPQGRQKQQKSWWRQLFLGRRLIPVSTAVIIGSFSVLEILESSKELVAKWHVQHWRGAHGITLLALIRLGRSCAILQTQAEELEEQVEEITESTTTTTEEEKVVSSSSAKGLLSTIQSTISSFITSPITAIVACIMAVVASIVEIIDDLRPGAHHGAALLALSELYYQFRRLTGVTGTKRKLVQFNFPIGIPIALAAAVFAAMEIVEDIQPGAHHGLAILALAELVENINRSKVLY